MVAGFFVPIKPFLWKDSLTKPVRQKALHDYLSQWLNPNPPEAPSTAQTEQS